MYQESSNVHYPGVNVKTDGKLVIIQLNVPKRKNALTPAMVKM
jgi:enoyl-CoA hydratase/carnithine racemase